MRKHLYLLTVAAFTCLLFHQNLSAQNDAGYVIVEYMKVKPGMWEKYLECEKAWKLVHQYRVKESLITGWELEQVVFPAGTDTEYDFLTVTHYKNWKAMGSEVNWYDAALKTLPADKREIAQNADLYRDLVKSEVWTTGDMVFASGGKRPLYAVENFMKIPAGGWEDWVEMESKFVKPVHEKSIAMGNRAGWLMGFMVMPRGDGYPYQASTVDYYNTWEDMGKDEGKAWQAVYPGMSEDRIGQKIESTRSIYKTEVRRLVDFVE
ncbi:MAG: hypothetical protein SFU99_17535 [Saprospiraceae bacterium]|nr:hypothetical protein [Saprospiraceae bacterium]